MTAGDMHRLGTVPVLRRQVLTALLGTGAVVVGGCSQGGRSARRAPGTTASPPATVAQLSDTPRTEAFVAGLEALALDAYAQIAQIVAAGKAASPSPVFAAFINAAADHHRIHLEAWNAKLKNAGRAEVSKPDPGLTTALVGLVQKAVSVGVAEAALSVEQLIAANYVTVTPSLGTSDTIQLAASTEVVEMEHVAIALFLLRKPPLASAFANDALSR